MPGSKSISAGSGEMSDAINKLQEQLVKCQESTRSLDRLLKVQAQEKGLDWMWEKGLKLGEALTFG